jgi:hypothetical protein
MAAHVEFGGTRKGTPSLAEMTGSSGTSTACSGWHRLRRRVAAAGPRHLCPCIATSVIEQFDGRQEHAIPHASKMVRNAGNRDRLLPRYQPMNSATARHLSRVHRKPATLCQTMPSG